MNIAIVGAGVIGVTTAIALQNSLPKSSRLTIFADLLTPETTGDGSAGLWGPYYLGDTPESDITRWAGETHRWFEHFWKSGLAPETGISIIPVTRVTKIKISKPEWISLVYGGFELNDEELQRLNEENETNYKSGLQFVTYTAEPIRLLPWLMNKFTFAGGIIRNKRINTFDELGNEGYDVVINCSGLGARELANDSSVVPVRGHVMRVKAPWIFNVFLEEDNPGNYIIPNIENVVLGGTGQSGDYDLTVREIDAKFIRDGCRKILPALEGCEVVKDWIGLRPGRPRVRLESEHLQTANKKKILVIHNYGHGGSGVTLCWGCALDVVQILKKSIKNQYIHFSSKL